MKRELSLLFRGLVIAIAALGAGIVGLWQGGFFDSLAYAAIWGFVVWVALRQPAALLGTVPMSIFLGLLDGSTAAATSGALLGMLAFWAVAAPKNSPPRRFSRDVFDEVLGDDLARPFLVFLLSAPFVLVGVLIAGGVGYLIAGDMGGGIGAIMGMMLGVLGGMRYFERVEAHIAPWQWIILVGVAVVVSLTYERVLGGLVLAMIIYVVLGISLIIWSRSRRPE